MNEVKRASEVLKSASDFNADWSINDAMDDFILVGVEFRDTRYGDAVILTCERDGETHRLVTWSEVIVEQARALADNLPVVARVVRMKSERGRAYYALQ